MGPYCCSEKKSSIGLPSKQPRTVKPVSPHGGNRPLDRPSDRPLDRPAPPISPKSTIPISPPIILGSGNRDKANDDNTIVPDPIVLPQNPAVPSGEHSASIHGQPYDISVSEYEKRVREQAQESNEKNRKEYYDGQFYKTFG